MTTPILSIANLKVFYGVIQAIRGVTIEIKEGEIVCLIGANGAGKSTLLMSIFGYPRASSGTILFQGENITQVESHKIIHFIKRKVNNIKLCKFILKKIFCQQIF